MLKPNGIGQQSSNKIEFMSQSHCPNLSKTNISVSMCQVLPIQLKPMVCGEHTI